MRKHMKSMAIVLAAILVLTIGLTTAVFASGSTGDDADTSRDPIQTFISKVADILGLEEEPVGDAFRQARQEMCVEARDGSVEQRLERAVADGRLSQEQADEILTWWQNRPEGVDEIGPCACLRLQEAVESGRFSQEQADEILTWWNNRPEVLQEIEPHEFVQMLNDCQRQQIRQRLCAAKQALPRLLTQVFDARISGTIADLSEGTITLAIEDGTEVIIDYTSSTDFVLHGVTAIEEGQTAVAWCWEDAEGDLTARVVQVRLP